MNDSAISEASLEKEKGNEYFKAGKFEEAISCYSKAIAVCDVQKVDQLSVFYSNRAVAKVKLQRYYSAIDDATQSFMLNKKFSKPLYFRYKARMALLQLNEALIDISAVCILESENVAEHIIERDELLNQLSALKAKQFTKNLPKVRVDDDVIKDFFKKFKNHALFDESCDGERLTSYLANLKNTPNVENRDAKLWLTEATICFFNKDLAEAQKFAALANTSVTNDAKLKVTALIYLNISTVATLIEMLKIYDDAILVDRRNVDIYFSRAHCYFEFGLFDEGMSDLQRCIEMDSTFEAAYLSKFTVNYSRKNCKDPVEVKKMFEQFERYIADHPNSTDAPIRYLHILKECGQTEKAVEIISQALDRNPDDSTLLKEKALLIFERNSDEAHALILKALSLNCIYKKELYTKLGIIAATQREVNQTFIYWDKAIALCKNDYDLRGYIHGKEIISSGLKALNIIAGDANAEDVASFIKGLPAPM